MLGAKCSVALHIYNDVFRDINNDAWMLEKTSKKLLSIFEDILTNYRSDIHLDICLVPETYLEMSLLIFNSRLSRRHALYNILVDILSGWTTFMGMWTCTSHHLIWVLSLLKQSPIGGRRCSMNHAKCVDMSCTNAMIEHNVKFCYICLSFTYRQLHMAYMEEHIRLVCNHSHCIL